MVDLGQIIGAADRGALVEADAVGGGDPVGEEAGDGRGVQPLDVIAFEEGVDDQLPVGGDVVGPAAVEMVAGEAEGVEIGRERVASAKSACAARANQISPPASTHGKRIRPMRRLVEPGKQSARGMPASSPSGV